MLGYYGFLYLQSTNSGIMTESFSTISFEMCSENGVESSWSIEKYPEDSLSDLLERLAEKSYISVEDFTYVYQYEYAKMEDGELSFFVKVVKGEKKMLASHDRLEEIDNFLPVALCSSNTHITNLDDILCPNGLSPVITIDLRLRFFEFDSSGVRASNVEALDDVDVVAWIEIMYLSDLTGEMTPVVLLHSYQRFVDVRSGEIFDNCMDFLIASRIQIKNIRKDFGVVLLKDKSPLLKWPIAPDLRTHIALRDGADFSIENGFINVQEGSHSKRWIYPKKNQMVHIPPNSKPHVLKERIMNYISS